MVCCVLRCSFHAQQTHTHTRQHLYRSRFKGEALAYRAVLWSHQHALPWTNAAVPVDSVDGVLPSDVCSLFILFLICCLQLNNVCVMCSCYVRCLRTLCRFWTSRANGAAGSYAPLGSISWCVHLHVLMCMCVFVVVCVCMRYMIVFVAAHAAVPGQDCVDASHGGRAAQDQGRAVHRRQMPWSVVVFVSLSLWVFRCFLFVHYVLLCCVFG